MVALLSPGLLPGDWALLSSWGPHYSHQDGEFSPNFTSSLERTDSRSSLRMLFFFFFAIWPLGRGLQLGAG